MIAAMKKMKIIIAKQNYYTEKRQKERKTTRQWKSTLTRFSAKKWPQGLGLASFSMLLANRDMDVYLSIHLEFWDAFLY